MDRCSSCDAEREAADGPCGTCGASPPSHISLELDIRPRAPVSARPSAEVQETSIDLAFDPRERQESPIGLVRKNSVDTQEPGWGKNSPKLPSTQFRSALQLAQTGAADPDASDAWLLADYGEPPKHWLLSPLYAWRVLRRRRAIERALLLRRDEAARAATGVEDALVALAERVRPIAEGVAAYADAIDALTGAERVLHSRDQVLASEHDEQAARLGSIDARLAKLESELAEARTDARDAATALVSVESALAREESNLKRAENELRSSVPRAPAGTRE
jgi:hypothetical protein